jgi:hypothetical protein
MGLVHAKVLLLNHRYAAADKLLTHLDVLPAEGATSGRELYREAKLMEAVGSIKKKQYRNALVFINDAKRWPENLGSGEPYPQDKDLRLEDFFTLYCRTAMQKGPLPSPPVLTSPTDTRILGAL